MSPVKQRLERVREQYRVPAKLHGKVDVDGRQARIVDATPSGMNLLVLFSGESAPRPVHPTYGLRYH